MFLDFNIFQIEREFFFFDFFVFFGFLDFWRNGRICFFWRFGFFDFVKIFDRGAPLIFRDRKFMSGRRRRSIEDRILRNGETQSAHI